MHQVSKSMTRHSYTVRTLCNTWYGAAALVWRQSSTRTLACQRHWTLHQSYIWAVASAHAHYAHPISMVACSVRGHAHANEHGKAQKHTNTHGGCLCTVMCPQRGHRENWGLTHSHGTHNAQSKGHQWQHSRKAYAQSPKWNRTATRCSSSSSSSWGAADYCGGTASDLLLA
jgi:hypothetical protein